LTTALKCGVNERFADQLGLTRIISGQKVCAIGRMGPFASGGAGRKVENRGRAWSAVISEMTCGAGAIMLWACLKLQKSSWMVWSINLRICGGFFDVAQVQKRLGELDALMAGESFWNNREQAQKLIDESNSLRKKIDPLLKAERQAEDFKVMV